MNYQETIDDLNKQLDVLVKRQEGFFKEIYAIRQELKKLKAAMSGTTASTDLIVEDPPIEKPKRTVREALMPPEQGKKQAQSVPLMETETGRSQEAPVKQKSTFSIPEEFNQNLERFIGENLISKIGILITVIGVGIGVKYAIDHDLISPLLRIILGYGVGLGLLGFALRFKENYTNFSAVLLSGAMAIFYFVSFIGYEVYMLFPLVVAFGLMVFFTIFTVLAALHYNMQIIAHMGLVGAYAVPFLLSKEPGDAAILFGYMAIINTGILFISFKKYWKPLFYAAFISTWLIFNFWYQVGYSYETDYSVGLIFLSIFFLQFYTTFLAYKLVRKEAFKVQDGLILVINAFIFFGFGYIMLDDFSLGRELLGPFAVLNALIHFGVSWWIQQRAEIEQELKYLLLGLVILFATIAIPIQLDGVWVTLIWMGMAVLLFWIGQTKSISVYRYFAYPLMILTFFSLCIDWFEGYLNEVSPSILNPYFLTGLLVVLGFVGINWFRFKQPISYSSEGTNGKSRFINYFLPIALLLISYLVFLFEITNYWEGRILSSKFSILENDFTRYIENSDLRNYRSIWIINYSIFFFTVLSFVNMKWLKHAILARINMLLSLFCIGILLTSGMEIFWHLQKSFINQELGAYYNIGPFHIGIRYLSYGFVGAALFAIYRYMKQDFWKEDWAILFDAVLGIVILWILSYELISWLEFYGSGAAYKYGLSILWGTYALIVMGLGIWKKKKHLRIGSMLLFALTLIKLFMYDLVALNTIAKTIVFVALGVLLLIISFLYNKYKHVIFEESDA